MTTPQDKQTPVWLSRVRDWSMNSETYLAAIRLYRSKTGSSLKIAKENVDAFRDGERKDTPLEGTMNGLVPVGWGIFDGNGKLSSFTHGKEGADAIASEYSTGDYYVGRLYA